MDCYKKGVLSFIFIFHFTSFSFCQSVLIPFREGHLWGYADTNGVIQIKPAFDKVGFFNYTKNIAEVFKDTKISLIDPGGKALFPFSDSYYQFADNYIVTQNGKKGIYTKQGRQLLAFGYDHFECTCAYEKYRKEINKIIGVKNSEYYLIDFKTTAIKKLPKPNNSRASQSSEGIVAMPVDEFSTTGVPNPQLQSRDFPKLSGYTNLVHCETVYLDIKPVFYVFCIWKDGKMIGYMGQNGVAFYKD
jgi:hypothetical protein